MNFKNTLSKTTIFDFFFYIYLLSLARQFMWIIPNNMVAWICSFCLAVILWFFYVKARVKFLPYLSKTEPWFYLLFIVAFIFFLLVIAYPEGSTDTTRIRFSYQEIGLLRYPFNYNYDHYLSNILGEMMNGIFRKIFGLRMGLLINFIIVVWTMYEIKEILSKYIQNKLILILAMIFTLYGSVLTAQGLDTYFVDFHAIPIVLLSFRLAISKDNDDYVSKLFFISFLLGLIFAIKYSNLVYVVPIGLVALFNQRKLIIKKPYILFSFFFFLLPNLPFMLYSTLIFKSPLFPLYNTIFKSPYAPLSNWKDGRWGPSGIYETLIWPFKIILQQKIGFHEASTYYLYSGRLTLGYLIGLISLPYIIYIKRYDILKIIFIIVFGIFLWSFSTGYGRYMLSLEYLSVCFLFIILSINQTGILFRIAKILIIIAICLSFAISVISYLPTSNFRTWNSVQLNKNTILKLSTDYKFFFNDRNLRNFVDPYYLTKIDKVDRWFHFSFAYATLLNIKPMYCVPRINQDIYFQDKINEEFHALLSADELSEFIQFSNKNKLTLLDLDLIPIRYFSSSIDLMTILVRFSPSDKDHKYVLNNVLNRLKTKPIRIGETINNDSDKLFFHGFSGSEVHHRWSVATLSNIFFTVDNVSNATGKLTLNYATYGPQAIIISLNGTVVANLPKNDHNDYQDVIIYFDKKLLNPMTNNLSFELPDVINTKDTQNTLYLAIAFKTLTLN